MFKKNLNSIAKKIRKKIIKFLFDDFLAKKFFFIKINSVQYFTSRDSEKILDLSRSFNSFIRILILLLVFWFSINSYLIYINFKNSLSKQVKFQIHSIDKSVGVVFDSITDHINFIADKSFDLNIFDNQKKLKNFLKKTANHNLEKNNISSWMDLNFISNADKKLGNIDKFYPIEEAFENKSWRLKIGKLTEIKKEEVVRRVLPIAMRIDDYDLANVGAFVSLIDVEIINKQIEQIFADQDVCYLLIDKNSDIISNSKNIELNKFQKKISNFDQIGVDKIDVNNSDIAFDNKQNHIEKIKNNKDFFGCNFLYSKKVAEYNFLILAGYNKKNFRINFINQLSDNINQSIGVVAIFILIILIFKKIRIKPFIDELIKAKEIAESSNSQKSQFLSILNHELRTPMNGIIGISQSLADNNKMSEEEKEQINLLSKSSESLLSTLNDILSFSNIVEKKVKIESINFNIRALVDDIAELMSLAIYNKGLELVIDVDDNVEEFLIGDPVRIRQILINLINNAIKFSFEGQILVRVELVKKIKDKFLINFLVQDNGVGIAENKIKNMFSQIIQTDHNSNRKFDGTGIGLTICKGLIDLMNGKIAIESRENFGTKVFFEIPLMKSEARFFNPFEEKKSQLKGKKIFLICENDLMRSVLIKKLEKLKTQIVFSNILKFDNPKIKISKIIDELKAAENIDVILSIHNSRQSFSMFDLIEKISQNELLKSIPLILAIAKSDKTKANPYLIDKAKYLICKPIRNDILIKALLYSLDLCQDSKSEIVINKNNQTAKVNNDKKLSILLCEDNEVNIKVMLLMMKKYPHQIDIAENGSEAIEKFRENKYDLILMDCMMPIMDGFEATKKIREIENQNNLTPTKIFALSANASQDDQNKCLEVGMDKFISKPIRREIIDEMLSKI